MESQRTVRDFKNFFLHKLNVENHTEITDFTSSKSTEDLRNFWKKLNKLGWDKKMKEPEECSDVDAAAPLTDKEWEELENEFNNLEK